MMHELSTVFSNTVDNFGDLFTPPSAERQVLDEGAKRYEIFLP